jgi:hypothetical protein
MPISVPILLKCGQSRCKTTAQSELVPKFETDDGCYPTYFFIFQMATENLILPEGWKTNGLDVR